jgi:hypothetical protein
MAGTGGSGRWVADCSRLSKSTVMRRPAWMASMMAVAVLLSTAVNAGIARGQEQATPVDQAALQYAADDLVGRLLSSTATGDQSARVEQTAEDWLFGLGMESAEPTVCHASEPRCLVVARRLAAEYHSELELIGRSTMRNAIETHLRNTYSADELATLVRFLATSAGRKTPIALPQSMYSADLREARLRLVSEESRLSRRYRMRLAVETSRIGRE